MKESKIPHNIVFDIGGVLAEICHSWEEAAQVSGVQCRNLGDGRTGLASLDAFDQYQAGAIGLDEYVVRLAEFVGCLPDEALRVHNGIIVEEFPGVADLIAELQLLGCRMGCLSNTNQPHWEELALNGRYPTIHKLEMKMASFLVGLNKPSPEIFELYCKTFGLEPNDIAFFDDYQVNVDSALTCGWQAKRIDPSHDTPAQIREFLRGLGVTQVNAIA